MIKFAAEKLSYETHVDTTREKRLHAIGSGHGVRELTAGAETRKVPRRGSALSP